MLLRSIEIIQKEMEELYENADNLTSNDFLTKSNNLKKEFERSKNQPLNYQSSFDYYFDNMIMF